MFQLKDLTNTLLNALFPIPCHICGDLVDAISYGVVCKTCWQKLLPLPNDSCCQRCGYPLFLAANYTPPSDCARCRPLTLNSARSCGSYQGALRAEILHLKKYPTISSHLTQLMHSAFQFDRSPGTSTLLIPVPLHPARERQRGFNQSQIIAQKLAKTTGLPIDTISLARIKSTPKHRAGLDFKTRSQSVNNAFKVLRPRLIAGHQIILIDDIFTTGSTVSACAATLLAAGALSVNVFTLARVVSFPLRDRLIPAQEIL